MPSFQYNNSHQKDKKSVYPYTLRDDIYIETHKYIKRHISA